MSEIGPSRTSEPPIADSNAPELSIVVPAYMEAGNLERLYEELVAALGATGVDWEVVIVDDGSRDRTWDSIRQLHRRDPRVKGLRLSRNFGHQYALFAGLSHARGQAVVTMDADLQHPPAVVPELLREWRQGSQVVLTVRSDDVSLPWLKRFTSKHFYRLFSYLSGVRLSPGMADFRLLDRQVVAELMRFPEAGLFLRGLVQWVGYRSTVVGFECGERFAGSTTYTLRRMAGLAWTGLTSFSVVPLRLAVVVGLLTSLVAFFQLASAIYDRIFNDAIVPGWASVIGLTSLLFGVLFILLGILGEYLARVLEEVRGRPRFLIAEGLGLGVAGGVDRPAAARPTRSESADRWPGQAG